MGWRFRKSFSPLPGIRITLSPRGVSTSLGVGPMRFTVGPQGAAVTSRIPGSGIAFRQSVGPGSFDGSPTNTDVPDRPDLGAPLSPVPPPSAGPIDDGSIRSAGTSELTSAGLAQLRELLAKTQQERKALLPELRAAEARAAALAAKRNAWERGWFLRRIAPGRLAQLQKDSDDAHALKAELVSQEQLSRLQTHIELPADARKAFSQVSDAFALVTRCERQWDTVSRVATDRVRERTSAHHSIQRTPVRFDLGVCELIESEWKVPHLPNANGGDLYLYPGFVLLHISADAFALVDITEVAIEAIPAPFLEEEGVPGDAQVVRQAWKKANKDGSPDRRFAGNYQIPVVEYATLRITSRSGLNEEYMLSNPSAVRQFATLWTRFKQSVAVATA